MIRKILIIALIGRLVSIRTPVSLQCAHDFCIRISSLLRYPSRFTYEMDFNIKVAVARFEKTMLPSFVEFNKCLTTLSPAEVESPVMCVLNNSTFSEAYEKMTSTILKQLQPINFDATSLEKVTALVHTLTQCVIQKLQNYSETFLDKL